LKNENIFEVKGVEYTYPGKVAALSGISFDVKKGDRIALIGANGSGKSTLLAMLDGLIYPDKGSVAAFGRQLTEAAFNDGDFTKIFRSSVGFVFQNPEIQLFCPTVREDIAFGPLCLGMNSEEAGKLAEATAEKLGIKDLLERQPHRLSIGEKKKAAIAAVLALDPEVLLLDEPTAGLDPLTTRHIVEILSMASGEGKTIITATHDLHIVEEIADIAYVLGKDKKIAAYGPAGEILGNRRLLDENNLAHVHIHSHGHEKPHIHPHIHGKNK
jgi:cobalt/nickel transport system ATP-binding protein